MGLKMLLSPKFFLIVIIFVISEVFLCAMCYTTHNIHVRVHTNTHPMPLKLYEIDILIPIL